MPNWCFTSYCFEGEKAEITDLFQKLQSLSERKESLLPNSFGKRWLGNVVHLFDGDWEKIYCRGSFDNLEMTDDILKFDTETAWGEMNEVWDFVKKSYTSIRYFWMAEESGNVYYATNDSEGKYYPERFLIEETTSGTERYETEGEVLKDLSNILNITVNTWDEIEPLIDKYNEEHPDETIHVNKIDIVE